MVSEWLRERVQSQGTEDGTEAGKWVFDGNSSVGSMDLAIEYSDNADPRLDEILPVEPSTFPEELRGDLDAEEVSESERDELLTTYLEFWRDACESEVVEFAREMVSE